MARKKDGKGRKVRVSFRQNREQRQRNDDWTRRYHAGEERLDDERLSESVRAKGDLSRKRTIIVDDADVPLVDETLWKRGLVVGVHGLVCRVERDDGAIWECTVRGVLRTMLIEQRSSVTVGDNVWFSDQSDYHDGESVGVVERVDVRRSALSRRERRGREHTLVANADQLLIVASIAQPRLKPHLIDRYLVAAIQGDLRPVIVFNKWDLLGERHAGTQARRRGEGGEGSGIRERGAGKTSDREACGALAPDDIAVDFEGAAYRGPRLTVEQIVEEFRALGYTCLQTCAISGLGLEALRDELRGRMTVLSGQSGVGKSSLLNALQPGLGLAVAQVSEETEKGRHTTTLSRLLRLEFGGHVVDTPGIRAFELWNFEPGALEACFTEFVERVPHCKFRDCHHTSEAGCAVRAAVEAGTISGRRYDSYLKMLEELARA